MIPDPSTPSSFEDPNLKAALRRACGAETAPPALRRRVEAALAAEGLGGAGNISHAMRRTSRSFWRRGGGFGMAAAAAVVLGIGLAAIERRHASAASGSAVALAASLPSDLGNALIRTHDACFRFHPTDHHMFDAAPKDNFPAIAQAMSAQLHHPVIATAMGHDWNFHGAAICPVGGVKSAHLVYARGDAVVSVFSLPASSILPACPDHQNCDAALNGHPLAGFVESGGFYCVVASSISGKAPIDAGQIKAMRDQLHGDVVAANANHNDIEPRLASLVH